MISIVATIIFSVTPVKLDIDKSIDSLVNGWGITRPAVVYINTGIDAHTASKFADDMAMAEATGQKIIPVVINTYGGSVYALLQMIDVIKMSKAKVATIVIGKAMSAGAVLLSCGAKGMRYAAPNSTIMIHEVSSFSQGKVGAIKADASETDRLNTLLFEMMAENIGKAKNYFLTIQHNKGHIDWFLTPKEAKKHNLVNHVGIPTLKVKLTIKETLVLE